MVNQQVIIYEMVKSIYSYLSPITKHKPHIFPAVHDNMIDKSIPRFLIKFRNYIGSRFQLFDKLPHSLMIGLYSRDLGSNFLQPCFCRLKALCKSVVAFVVLILILLGTGVFCNQLLDKTGHNLHFCFQCNLFFFKL